MIKKLAFGCLLVVAITGIALYVAWRQATRLPDWYGEPQGVAAAVPAPADEGSPGVDSPGVDSPGVDSPAEDSAAERAAGSRAPARSAPRDETAARVAEPGVRDLAPTAPPAAGPAGPAPPPAPAPAPRAARQGTDLSRPGRVELGEAELNDLLQRSLDEHPRGRRLKRAVKAVRASIDGDRLEIGVVANLDDLAAAAESEREARAVRRLARLAPWLGNRDVYLAVRGRPRVRDGQLVLDRDGELKVGGIAFDIADLATRLGVPEEKLDRGVELPLSGMTVEDVEVVDGRLVLSLAEDR